jgi:hypothetical protein
MNAAGIASKVTPMHAEHAELIAALRAEVNDLNVRLGKANELKAIVEAQDRLLIVAEKELQKLRDALTRQGELIAKLRETYGRYESP